MSAIKQPDSVSWKQLNLIAQREHLAKLVAYEFAQTCVKLVDLADLIRDLWKEFEKLPPGETILGCRTKAAFCEEHLHRKLRTIQYMLAGGNPKNKTRSEIISSLPRLPKFPIPDYTPTEPSEDRSARGRRTEARAREMDQPASPPDKGLLWVTEPVSVEVRTAALAIIDKGYKAESMLKHPDHGGTHESMVAVNAAVRLLRDWIEWRSEA